MLHSERSPLINHLGHCKIERHIVRIGLMKTRNFTMNFISTLGVTAWTFICRIIARLIYTEIYNINEIVQEKRILITFTNANFQLISSSFSCHISCSSQCSSDHRTLTLPEPLTGLELNDPLQFYYFHVTQYFILWTETISSIT